MALRLYLDFEATGLDPKNADIIQIGAVAKRQNEEKIADFESLVKTKQLINSKVFEITKINNKLLENAPLFQTAIDKFQTWLDNIRSNEENVIIIAYNALKYDIPLLCHNLVRNNVDLISFFKRCRIISFLDPLIWARFNLDTCNLIRNKRGKCSYKLGDIYKSFFGVNFANAHNAMADCIALMKVCEHKNFDRMHFKVDNKSVFDIYKFLNALNHKKEKPVIILCKKRKIQENNVDSRKKTC